MPVIIIGNIKIKGGFQIYIRNFATFLSGTGLGKPELAHWEKEGVKMSS